MSNNERIYRIDQLLNDRKIVSFQELLDLLEISPATLKRDLAYMRDRLNAPIIYDRELNGYKFEGHENLKKYELPGLWFSAEEIYALLTMEHLLLNIDNGRLLTPHIKPLLSRLRVLIEGPDHSYSEIKKRVKIETFIGSRPFCLANFEQIGFALLERKKLKCEYMSRGNNELTKRNISPQRLLYYKGNWYLDAWCELREDLRSFSLERFTKVEILDKTALDVDESTLDAELTSGYGIFAGSSVEWAKLKFSAPAARWVSEENWHPRQEGKLLEDGSYELNVPYSHERELLMDIMRHGSSVQVISPPKLRQLIVSELKKIGEYYSNDY
jgi:predicted DNA-binding transcriptional regulator YafY